MNTNDQDTTTAIPIAHPPEVHEAGEGSSSSSPIPLEQMKLIRDGVRPEGSAGSQPDVDHRNK